jgi:hypothetical protein
MKLTMPQILMLNHAAAVNKVRLDRQMRRGQPRGAEPGYTAPATTQQIQNGWPLFEGTPINKLKAGDYRRYLSSIIAS